MHKYKTYGLIFASELLLPELEEATGAPDVTIKIGSVPHSAQQDADRIQFFQASPHTFLLWHKDVAGYCVKNGREITIDPYMNINAPDIRLILLGSVFCALLHQRKFLVLHGASVVIQGKGILLTGMSGIGKSTLAGFLEQKGYELLTDDVCAVTKGPDEVPYIEPGFPSLKLWKDSAELLGSSTEGLEPVIHNREKFRIGIQNYHNSHPVTFNELYILTAHDRETIVINPVLGTARLDALIKNTYRYGFLHDQGIKAKHFKQCAAVAGQINVYQILRPRNAFLIKELAEAVENSVLK